MEQEILEIQPVQEIQPVHVNLNKLFHSKESDFPYDREFVNQCSIFSRYTAAY